MNTAPMTSFSPNPDRFAIAMPTAWCRTDPQDEQIHVRVAHAAPLIRAGLVHVLEHQPDMIATTGRVDDAADDAEHQVVIVDGAGALSLLAARAPGHAGAPRILVVGSGADDPALAAALQAGADACFILGGAIDDLVRTVRGLADRAGNPPFAPSQPPTAARGGLPPGALRRVREHMEERLSDRIELCELASIARLSECHFSRAFKQSVGVPPHRYLMLRRVRAAAELIKRTDRTLTEISLEVGFSDQSHFTRTFARTTGETPRAYRQRHR